MTAFHARHEALISFTLSCFDRVVITGTLPDICHAGAMEGFLRRAGVRLFDYPRWAEPLRDEIRGHIEGLAASNGLEVEFIPRNDFRKEERVKAILAQRGDQPGVVHIFSAMEPCTSFRPWHDKKTHETSLKYDSGKCLHYYVYLVDESLGLMYVRIPTWAPFRLQVYFNGHNAVARGLTKAGIDFEMVDNAFVSIAKPDKAQALADALEPKRLHRILDRLTKQYCPVSQRFPHGYHWSLMQVEFSTDVVFRHRDDFQPLYESLVTTAVHAIKPEHVATFLGRKLTGSYQGEIVNDLNTRILGTRIRHQMGPVSIKLYDKIARIARIETTANDVTFFKHHRRVEHRDGSSECTLAPLRKSIYSLYDLRTLMLAANRRYLDWLGAIEDPAPRLERLDRITRPEREHDRSYRGFNLFHGDDLDVFRALADGAYTISGFRVAHLRQHIAGLTAGAASRLAKRMRLHGLIKKIGRTYKYHLTELGRSVVASALKLRELVVIPLFGQPIQAKMR
jgi:hypothetical protein